MVFNFAKALGVKELGFAAEIPGTDTLITVDGVGTKAIVPEVSYETIGRDLVAANFNDILAAGGYPTGFLNYVATGAMTAADQKNLAIGISRALSEGNSPVPVLGGETCVTTDFQEEFVGMMVGRRHRYFGKPQPGDIIYGIESNGPHCNGFTELRRLGLAAEPDALRPTRIYLPEVTSLSLMAESIKGFAHITGGGLEDNIARVLPDERLKPVLNYQWEFTPFWRKVIGSQPSEVKDFNLGIGFVVIASPTARLTPNFLNIGVIE